ncbi:XRE family transcriptional regulator [Phyllobacterium sp. CL33Tsu]|uniref:XRE family transcriptional regulator n=1 Tax=Phyllobacterium sp. CL33Tsu TaxID=1798191 RepID=UPI001FCD7AEB|nr:XRE family transcriptional regulator [Phyllobacterium sp. CL33Tsu]
MARNVANIATNASQYVANMEKDRIVTNSYAFRMLSEWLQTALDESGVSQSELSRLLTERLTRSIDRAAVNKMLKGTRTISGEELLAIEAITGTTAPKELHVPLKGKVGAGAAVFAIDDGGDDTVEAPADARHGTVAVQVSGDSMFPAYEEGTLLYYSKLLPPSELVNKRAVVQLADGRIFVKIVRPGMDASRWTLTSINGQYADMVDQIVEWAAPIDWIRPR